MPADEINLAAEASHSNTSAKNNHRENMTYNTYCRRPNVPWVNEKRCGS